MRRLIGIVLILAVTLMSVTGGHRVVRLSGAPVTAKAAETTGKYIKSLIVSYADSKEKAEKELGEEYTVLNVDLNKELSGHAWLGYTTTDNEDEAIRDIKAMEMNGKYSVSEYEELLKNQKETVKKQVDTLVQPLIEYAKNCDADLPAATETRQLLNMYYEDDSGKNIGDYFYELGIAFKADAEDKSARADIEKMFVEGNDTILTTIENVLINAQGTKVAKNGSWMTKMSALGPEGLTAIYKKAYPNLKKAALKKKLDEDFSQDALFVLNELPAIRKEFQETEDSDFIKAVEEGKTADEAASDIIDDVPDGFGDTKTVDDVFEVTSQTLEAAPETLEVANDVNNQSVLLAMQGMSYGEGTMYDFFMREDLTKEELYPMAYVLSSGQKSLISDIGLMGLFGSISTEYVEEGDATEEADLGEHTCSVYDGVDRDIFKGDTAITEETLKWAATNEVKDIFGVSDNLTSGLIAAGCTIAGMIFTGLFIRAMTKQTAVTTYKYMFATTLYQSSEIIDTMLKECTNLLCSDSAVGLNYLQQWNYIAPVNIGKMSISEINTAYAQAVASLGPTSNLDNLITMTMNNQRHWQVSETLEQIDDLISKNTYKSETITTQVPTYGWGARIAYLVAAVVTLALAAYEIYCMVKRGDSVHFTDIPGKMISRTYENDEVQMVNYTVVSTKSGKKADLHNWKGKAWQALYTTMDERAGDPILASSLYTTDDAYQKEGEGMQLFSEAAVENLYDSRVLGKDGKKLYLFYEKALLPDEEVADADDGWDDDEEEASDAAVSGEAAGADNTDVNNTGVDNTEGSAFGSGGTIWIILGLIVVALFAAGGGIYYRKRKKE